MRRPTADDKPTTCPFGPNATLLTTWFSVGRMADEWMTPLDRCHFLNEGDRIDVGDRVLTALRPPVFDNPTTRGLFDARTNVLWSVDTFALPVAQPIEDAADIPDDEFAEGQLLGARLVAPWHAWLDEAKYHAYVGQVQSMPIEVVASCHAPALRGERVARAFDVLHDLPATAPWQPFTQADLEQWVTAMAGAHG